MTRVSYIRPRVLLLSALCAALLTASALFMPATGVNAEDDDGTLRIAIQQDVPDMNIFNLASDSIWKTKVLSWAFEGIGGIDMDGVPYPLLAESWVFHEDTLSLAVTLRQGILFHDGHELKADDVVFTYCAVRAGTVYSSYLVDAFDQDGDGRLSLEEMNQAVLKTDTYSVTLQMATPYAQFFSSTLTVPIIPQHIWDTHLTPDGVVDVLWSDEAATVGTGPFAYSGGMPGEYRDMAKCDTYWGKDFMTPDGYRTYPPNVDLLHFEIVGDIDSAIAALTSDQVDHISWPVPADRLPALEADPSIGIELMADNGYFYLAFNEKFDPFGSLSFRRAVAHLVDKETIVDEYMGGLGIEGTTCLPPFWGEWHNDGVEGYAYDDPEDSSSTVPEDLLDSAGFVDTDGDGWRDLPDGSPMGTISILGPPEDYDPIRTQTIQMIAENMRAVGIDAVAAPTDFTTLVAMYDSMDYQMLVLGWRFVASNPVSEVFDVLSPFSASNMLGFWSLENPNPYYSDLQGVCTLADAETQAMADGLLELEEAARSTFFPAEQQAAVLEAQALISEAVPVDVLYYRVNAEAYGDAWTGWVPYLGELLNVFSLSQLEQVAEEPLEGAITVVKGDGAPSDSAAQFGLEPTFDGTWTGVVQNNGLKGLVIEVYDVSSDEAVMISSTKLSMRNQPTGTFAVNSVLMTAEMPYLVVLTPLGPEGGQATLTWSVTSP